MLYDTNLYHYGVKGMKWGIRRYQNKDGSLTSAGKKRISKQYKKEVDKATKVARKTYNSRYSKSYHKATDEMNRSGIDKFNAEQKKKYGENYANRSGYLDDFYKLFDDTFDKYYNQTLTELYDSNKHYQKAQQLVDKYKMTSWDDFAKSNDALIREIRDQVRKGR